MGQPEKIIELYQKQLDLTIDINDLSLQGVYPLVYWSITSYFDANGLFWNRKDFKGYNYLISEWQILSETSVSFKNPNIYLYKLINNSYFPIYPKDTLLYEEGYDIYKVLDLSIFKTEDLRI